MNQLAIIVGTVHWEGWSRCISSWRETATGPYAQRTFANMPILEAYQAGFEESKEPILGFLHDDLIISEKGWDQRVLDEFEDSNVGMVGFGGALGLGDLDIYQKPYELIQLARYRFLSNMRDAEVNGERFEGECDISTLDGFSMFVRRDVLVAASLDGDLHYNFNGWPVGSPVNYFLYDAWLSCEVRRQGYRTRLVGVACDHLNGKSTGLGKQKLGQEEFEASHRYLYDTARDVLPMRVKE